MLKRKGAVLLKAQINNFARKVYLHGPDGMVKNLRPTLKGLGATVENMPGEK